MNLPNEIKLMIRNYKILIAGVGGQGIVYLTNIIVEAAMLCEIPVSVSEIHGLSQRGGIVTAGIGLGKYCTGFTGKANVDFLIGLEALETQRCLPYLHKKSSVIFCDHRISPYAVNANIAEYPDVISFAEFIKGQCREVVMINEFPENLNSVMYNMFLLGAATTMKDFSFDDITIEKSIARVTSEHNTEKNMTVFRQGVNFRQPAVVLLSLKT